jgi:hypothetical protein
MSENQLGRSKPDEILEALALDINNDMLFWRVSSNGLATTITNHNEDREIPQYRQQGLIPGTWLRPFNVTKALAELVLHAFILSEWLPSADTVEFRCEWSGLLERRLSDPDQMGYDAGQIARTNHIMTVSE